MNSIDISIIINIEQFLNTKKLLDDNNINFKLDISECLVNIIKKDDLNNLKKIMDLGIDITTIDLKKNLYTFDHIRYSLNSYDNGIIKLAVCFEAIQILKFLVSLKNKNNDQLFDIEMENGVLLHLAANYNKYTTVFQYLISHLKCNLTHKECLTFEYLLKNSDYEIKRLMLNLMINDVDYTIILPIIIKKPTFICIETSIKERLY